jgi:hypothetical protein
MWEKGLLEEKMEDGGLQAALRRDASTDWGDKGRGRRVCADGEGRVNGQDKGLTVPVATMSLAGGHIVGRQERRQKAVMDKAEVDMCVVDTQTGSLPSLGDSSERMGHMNEERT